MTLFFHERLGKIVKAEEKKGGGSSGWEVCALRQVQKWDEGLIVSWGKVKSKVNQISIAFNDRMRGWQSIRWATKPVHFGDEE